MAASTNIAGGMAASSSSTGNGVITDKPALGEVAVNKKKQKRRQKQAARSALTQDQQGLDVDFSAKDSTIRNGYGRRNESYSSSLANGYDGQDFADRDHFEAADDTQFVYSDEDGRQYTYDPALPSASDAFPTNSGGESAAKRKGKKKKKSKNSQQNTMYDDGTDPSMHYPPSSLSNLPPPPHPPISQNPHNPASQNIKDPIWNTSTSEERGRIKEFWLSLGEEERKSLVKIEKEAVLKKMKEQQKHSCSCTVCGRKRTAIEEELEVLYDAYYDELEQFANHQQVSGLDNNHEWKSSPARLPSDRPDRPPPLNHRKSSRGRIQELPDDEEDFEDDELDEEAYSEEDYDDEFSGDETDELPSTQATDFFNFGNSLTVKGGILTVADDLLKNDGKKFIDMMEQLAERRMQREEEAQYPPYGMHSSVPAHHNHGGAGHPPEEDEYDEEDDDEYDSQEDDFDDEDEMDQMTESQRMEEGRRMFQIFAARMFEQRVLTAYREKVALERQEKLIQELEDESRADTQRDAKKAREAEKKKQKKQQQKQKQAEEKARKEAEKAAQDAAAREEEEKKQEVQKRKREEQRKKKEAEKRAQEEEKQKRETERHRRQQGERERQQEAERKVREQKAEEKKRKDEAKKREREEREVKEKGDRDRKAQEEREQKQVGDKGRADVEVKSRKQQEDQAIQAADALKRSAVPAIVALPPGLKQKQTSAQPSPQAKVATPVIPKTPTPVRSRQTSAYESQGSPPQTPQAMSRSKQSTSPRTASGQQSIASSSNPATRTPSQQYPTNQAPPLSPIHPMGSSPGMSSAQAGLYGGMNSAPLAGYQGGQMGMPSGMMARQPSQPTPIYPPHQHQRPFMPTNATAPPPGMAPPSQILARGLSPESAPSFLHNVTASGPGPTQPAYPAARETMPSHSRQQSQSFDGAQVDAHHTASTQPIARPAPIQPPSSVKPGDGNRDRSRNSDVEDLSKHLGSSALIADDDEPLPPRPGSSRRPPGVTGIPNSVSTSFGASHLYDPTQSAFGPGSTWRSPISHYSTAGNPPTMASPPGWGSAPNSGWGQPNAYMPQHRPSNPRPITVRVLTCQACRQLSSRRPSFDGGLHDINDIVRQVDAIRPVHEGVVSMSELLNILDTEGDSQNGGGFFLVRREPPDRILVKWEADQSMLGQSRPGLGLGEIGSPVSGGSLGGLGPRPF